MRIIRAAAILVFPAFLTGCVAAAIPVLAGSVFAGKDRIGLGSKSSKNEDVNPQVTIAASNTSPAAAEVFPVARVAQPAVRAPTNLPKAVRPSAEKVPQQPALLRMAKPTSGNTPFSEISSYVENQAKRDPVTQPRLSAILASPGSLIPDRSDCSIRPSAAIFDLDPAGAVFDLALEVRTDPDLIQLLHSFRMQGIDIFWISEHAAVDAGKIRKKLVESSLDPMGRDGLLLMRRANDRKQARRHELSETHCVVAIAGDGKSDFDELYTYLKDVSAAEPLDDMLGAGWFLTPLPLLAQSASEGQ